MKSQACTSKIPDVHVCFLYQAGTLNVHFSFWLAKYNHVNLTYLHSVIENEVQIKQSYCSVSSFSACCYAYFQVCSII